MGQYLSINNNKNRRLLMFLVMMFTTAFCCFFAEGHTYFNSGVGRIEMNDLEFYLTFGACILMLASFFIMAKRYYKVRVNWWILILVTILLITDFLALYFFPGIYDTGELVYSLTRNEKIRYMLAYLVVILALYFTLGTFPQIFRDPNVLKWFFYALLIDAFVAFFYSLYHDFDIYKDIIETQDFLNPFKVPVSFTTNRNVYARLLFYGLVAECYLQCTKPRWYRFIFQLFFLANQLLALSKGTMMVAFVFYFLFLVYRYFATLKGHPKRNGFCLALFIILAIAFVVLYFLSGTSFMPEQLSKFIKSVISLFGSSFADSFNSRFYAVTELLTAQKGSIFTIVFGFGAYAIQGVMNAVIPVFPGDMNSVLDSGISYPLFQNGVIGAAINVIFVIFIIVLAIRSIARKSPHGWFMLILLISLLALSFVENIYFLGYNPLNIIALFMVAVPLLTEENTIHKKKDIQELSSYASPRFSLEKQVSTPSWVFKKTLFWTFLPFLSLIVSFIGSKRMGFMLDGYASTYFVACLAIAYVALPFFTMALSTLKFRHSHFGFLVVLLLMIAWAAALCLLPLKFSGKTLLLIFAGISFVLVVSLACLRLLPGLLSSSGWDCLIVLMFAVVAGSVFVFTRKVETFGWYYVMLANAYVLASYFFLIAVSGKKGIMPISISWDHIEEKATQHFYRSCFKNDRAISRAINGSGKHEEE